MSVRVRIFVAMVSQLALQSVSQIKVKFAYDGLVLGSSQFSLLPRLPQEQRLDSKVVKIDSKNNYLA